MNYPNHSIYPNYSIYIKHIMTDKKQTLITEHFKPSERFESTKSLEEPVKSPDTVELVYGYNEKTNSWHCLECGDDMGPTNPRQLCGKYYCRSKW